MSHPLAKFKHTPDPVVELLQEQLEGALQIIAALVLTDEESAKMIKARDPEARDENIAGWASEMREQILSDEYRPDVVEMLRHNGFLTNTHPGYPLARLKSPPTHRLARGYQIFEKMVIAYGDGDGEKIPTSPPGAAREYWETRLRGKKFPEDVVKFILDHDGMSIFWMAQLTRVEKPAEPTQEAP